MISLCQIKVSVGRFGALWVILMQLNKRFERRGLRNNWDALKCVEFQNFIDDLNLIDLPMLGKRFTWFKPDGSEMSRLDKFLVSDGWLFLWKSVAQLVGKTDVSDHCPIMLRGEQHNWGLKPFRFNNCWFKHETFGEFVKKAWQEIKVAGRKTYASKEKLKLIKVRIKNWNFEVFGILDLQINKLVNELDEWDELASNKSLDEEEVKGKKEASEEMWRAMKRKESHLFQKSRSQWLKEGDTNFAYVHACINMRSRKNNITALWDGRRWVEGVNEVRNVVKSSYQDLYTLKVAAKPTLDGISFRQLSTETNDVISAPLCLDEIKDVVWSCDGDKSPGPDGFNIKFFKHFWEDI